MLLVTSFLIFLVVFQASTAVTIEGVKAACFETFSFDPSCREVEGIYDTILNLTTVYTFNGLTGECESRSWKGCNLKGNMFITMEQCMNTCRPKSRQESSKVGGGFVPDITDLPLECRKLGVCENVPNYPHEHVEHLVEELGESRNFYHIDEVESPEITQRMGSNEETEMCQYTQKVIIPQAARDKTGKWFYILNTKENPLQGFNVELCHQDRSPCASIASFITGYDATCRQKYLLRYMTSIDQYTGEIVERSFKMPSCCSCVAFHFFNGRL